MLYRFKLLHFAALLSLLKANICPKSLSYLYLLLFTFNVEYIKGKAAFAYRAQFDLNTALPTVCTCLLTALWTALFRAPAPFLLSAWP